MNDELRALYEEDIADARTFAGEEALLASQARRARAAALLGAGAVRDADDFLHATFLFQHGERLEHWAMAHLLARTAADMGHPRAPYMVAASHDRWLMRQGLPQKYGTNSVDDGGRARVWPYDPRTTDAERAALGVPPLAELLARAERMNADVAARGPRPLLVAETHGVRVAIDELAPLAIEPHALPPYLPLAPGDPRPLSLPAGAALWRFGRMLCAKDAAGDPLCAWHRCGWRLIDQQPGLAPAALLAALGGAPQWLGAEQAYWRRLALPVSASECWIVGGRLPRDELARLARELPG